MQLTLKGLQGGFGDDRDLTKVRILHCDIEKDDGYELLVKIGHAIISAFLDKGVVAKKDLSHVRFDRHRGMWIPD